MCNVIFFVFTVTGIVHLGCSKVITDCIEDWPSSPVQVNDYEGRPVRKLGEYNIIGNLDDITFRTVLNSDDPGDLGYFDLSKSDDDTKVIWQTTDKLLNVDKDVETPTASSTYSVIFSISIVCDGESVPNNNFVTVSDTNNNPPTFNTAEKYTFLVPVPIMKSVDFSMYSEEPIEATDLDFSMNNSNMTFTLSSDDFEIISSKNKKTVILTFKATKTLLYTDDVSLTLTAKDTGTPPLETAVEIIISPDKETSLDVPSFSKNSYKFNYKIGDDGNAVLSSLDEQEIQAVTNKASNIENGRLEGDYQECFTLSRNDKVFQITPNGLLPEEVKHFTVLTIKYDTDSTATATAFINITADLPSFEKSSYKYSYTVENGVPKLDPDVEIIINSDKLDADKIYMEGDYASHFNKPNLNGKMITISLSTVLPDNAPSLVTMTLGYDSDYATQTTLIITVPASELKFDQLYYTGSFDVDVADSFQMNDDINIVTSLSATPEVSVSEDYKDKFEVDCEERVCTLTLNRIDDSDLARNEIIFSLKAKIGDREASSLVVISILKGSPENVFKFSQISYSGPYTINSDGEGAISEIEVEIQNAIGIELEKYSEYFLFNQDSSNTSIWKIEKKQNLPYSIVLSNEQLTIILEATDESGHIAKSILVVVMQTFEKPSFSIDHFGATYSIVGDEGKVELKEDITFSVGNSDGIDIICEGSFAEYFEFVFESEKWFVNVKHKLGDDILNGATNLLVSLTAKDKTYEFLSDNAILVVDLALTSDLKFDQLYYMGSYDVAADSFQMNDDINIVTSLSATPEVSVSEDYKDKFEVDCEERVCTLTLKGIDDSDLAKNEIIFSLKAKIGDREASSLVVISILKDSPENVFKFSQISYSGSYTINSDGEGAISEIEVEIQNAIGIELEKYSEYFLFNQDSSNTSIWKIEKKQNLPYSIVLSNEQLTIILEATDESGHIAQSILVIVMPTFEKPSFSIDHFGATYSIVGDEGKVELKEDITFSVGNSDDIDIICEGSFADYFEFVFESEKWFVNVKHKLGDDILNGATNLLVSLTAKDKTYEFLSDNAILVVDLALTSDLKFDQLYYMGSFDVAADSFQMNDDINIVTSLSATPEVSVSEDYKDKFDVDCEERVCTLTLKGIDDSDLARNEIIFSLKAKIGDREASSLVVISILKDSPENGFKFSQISYSGSYTINSDGEGAISEIEVEIQNAIGIELEKYSEYFLFNQDSSTPIWKIEKKQNLPYSIVVSNEQLTVILSATDESGHIAQSILVIDMPILEKPSFSTDHYSATYSIVGDEGKVELKEDITFSVGKPDNIDIFCDDSFADYFEFVIESEKWSVNVKRKLGDEILNGATNLLVSLTAQDKTYKFLSDNAILVVDLPTLDTEDLPQFTELYYSANYTLNGGKHDITDTNIKAVTKSGSNLKVTFTDDQLYVSFFELVEVDDHYALSLASNLDDKILNEEISITLSAEAMSNDIVAYASIVINLPLKVVPADLAFEKILYNGNIDRKGNLQISDTIKVLTEKDDNEISTEISNSNFENYFTITYADGTVSVSYSSENIPEDTLKEITLIPLELILYAKGSNEKANAVLNIVVQYFGIRDDDDSGVNTGYIIAVSILTVLLVGFIAGSIIVWYMKFRPRSFTTLEEDLDDTSSPKFEKNRKTSDVLPVPTEKRRPTGFVFNSLVVDETPEEANQKPPDKGEYEVVQLENEKPKTVAFDDVVEEIQIDTHDESEDTEDEGHYVDIDDEMKSESALESEG